MNHLDVFYQVLEIMGLPLPKNVDPATRCKWQNVFFDEAKNMTFAQPIFDLINMRQDDIESLKKSMQESIKREWNLP